MQICADLHIHTSASDGDLNPGKIVSWAHARGLDAIAITDHDTVAGIPEAIRTGEEAGIRIIPGVEISAIYEPGTMHILGYFPSYPQGLEKALEGIQDARRKRCPRIIEKLNALGMPVTAHEVAEIARDAQIGRPHIAKALIRGGYVRNYEEAFSQYLAKGRPAYVDKEKMTWEESLTLIHEYGGLPVLAHPFTLELQSHELRLLMERLVSGGLKGVEIFYPEHSRAQKKLYRSLARDLGLFATGGTDYHGTARNSVSPGDYGIDTATLAVLLDHLSP